MNEKYGFKTVRFPVTWMYFMDGSGNIRKDWMKRVKTIAGGRRIFSYIPN